MVFKEKIWKGFGNYFFFFIKKTFEGTERSGIYPVPGFLFWFLGFPCFGGFFPGKRRFRVVIGMWQKHGKGAPPVDPRYPQYYQDTSGGAPVLPGIVDSAGSWIRSRKREGEEISLRRRGKEESVSYGRGLHNPWTTGSGEREDG